MRKSVGAIGVAIRIGPPPASMPAVFDAASPQTALICAAVSDDLASARRAGLHVAELQIDFDCPESKLAQYLGWVKAIQTAAAPTPVVVTALPSWLRHAEFAAVAHEAGSFILQVHSLHPPAGPDAPMTLCDAGEARRAVADAARIGVPFRVALPTYTYLAAFSAEGKLLGLSAESAPPSFPPGTILRYLRPDADALADLVAQWSAAHPAQMTGLIWYRLPVSGDTMNWRPPTLRAVMAGRKPRADVHALAIRTAPGLFDIYLENTGDADAMLEYRIVIDWDNAALVAADAIGGFERLDAPAASVIFHPSRSPASRWIAPSQRLQAGWLRLSLDTEVRTHVWPDSP